jgi:outer membrane immunogenic protein
VKLLSLSGGVAIALVASLPVVAADMPLKAPPPAAPVANWTGVYVGANLGGAWQRADTSLGPAAGGFVNNSSFTFGALPSASSQDSSGILGGITLGYNVQRGALVYGIEGDAMGAHLSATSTANSAILAFPLLATSTTTETDWLATVRGRLGWLVSPDTLLYGTGGVAFGGTKGSTSITPTTPPPPSAPSTCATNAFCSTGSASGTQTGWAAGVGAERRFWGSWSAKIEYLHYDLGSFAYTANEASTAPAFAAAAGTPNVNVNTHVSGDIVRAGVNFHF